MKTTFLRELISKSNEPRVISSLFKFVSDPAALKSPDPLLEILGLDESILPEAGRLTLHSFEHGENYESYSDWVDFKWKLSAFVLIQDIFDAPIYESDYLSIFRIWYFYYESKYLLSEAVLCGLNGFYSACHALLRLFVEFNLLQNYYYRLALRTSSYRLLEKYFETHVHPSWGTVLKGYLPDDSFIKPIRFRIQMHLKALSQHYSHPYHPDHSPRQHTTTLCTPTLEGIFFWEGIRLLLDAILWTYYVNFPMLFHPRNTLKKFGFNGPVGLFINETGAEIVRRSLEASDYDSFLEYSSSHDSVASLTDWYGSLDSLTNEQILATWNKDEDGELHDILKGYSMQTAKLRCLRESLALKPTLASVDSKDDLTLNTFCSYSFWNAMLKRKKK